MITCHFSSAVQIHLRLRWNEMRCDAMMNAVVVVMWWLIYVELRDVFIDNSICREAVNVSSVSDVCNTKQSVAEWVKHWRNQFHTYVSLLFNCKEYEHMLINPHVSKNMSINCKSLLLLPVASFVSLIYICTHLGYFFLYLPYNTFKMEDSGVHHWYY